MKRWFFFSIALVILAVSVVLYVLPILRLEAPNIYLFILLIGSFILVFAAVYTTLNFQMRQKIKTLQNRLSMWTKLSYHVNQVGDEVFNELPIGILALDDEYEIKWANPHAKIIFDAKITGKNLKDVHPQLHQAAIQAKMNLTIQVRTETYDVIYRQEYK
ncbi:MAG: hypothetical protein IH571_06265, partial [Acholeplasmataceae bacterium]|nr:hypothetical protein [Acholeplasmataceae bacterium]